MSCSSGDTGTHCVVVVDPCDIYNCNETNEPRDTYTPPQTDYYDGGPGYGMEPYPTEQTNIIDKNNDRINDCWKGLYSTNATGANLSSDWGWRVINGNPDFHPGWDIGTAGQQGVNALFMGDAKVIAKGNDIYNGYWLSYELITDGTFVKYIHLDNLPSVSIDGVYSMGDVAGKIGKTGSTSQIHLHMAMYPSRQSYDMAISMKIGKSKEEKDIIDFNYSIDPATRFKSSICAYPSTVKSSNNTKPPSSQGPKDPRPCPTCAIP